MKIFIDIQNNPVFFKALQEHLPSFIFRSDAVIKHNSHWENYPNKTARYFSIDLVTKRFCWQSLDECPVDIYDVIESVEQIINLCNFISENEDITQTNPVVKERQPKANPSKIKFTWIDKNINPWHGGDLMTISATNSGKSMITAATMKKVMDAFKDKNIKMQMIKSNHDFAYYKNIDEHEQKYSDSWATEYMELLIKMHSKPNPEFPVITTTQNHEI